MKSIFALLVFLLPVSCARKVEVRAPEIIHAERFIYMKDDQGRWLIVTTTAKDFDQAMKTISPGPASVDKLDLWVITPLHRH
jgi:hypothetical protein